MTYKCRTALTPESGNGDHISDGDVASVPLCIPIVHTNKYRCLTNLLFIHHFLGTQLTVLNCQTALSDYKRVPSPQSM